MRILEVLSILEMGRCQEEVWEEVGYRYVLASQKNRPEDDDGSSYSMKTQSEGL